MIRAFSSRQSLRCGLNHHCDATNRLDEKEKPGANRRKGELRVSSPFPLGGFSALPHTGRITRLLEARPCCQAMSTYVRIRHLDLAARRQQGAPFDMSYFASTDRHTLEAYEVGASSHNGINHATMRSAAACDGDLRQRRLIWVGAAYRLAVAALLPPLTYVASNLGYELDRVVRVLDGQSYQAQALQSMLAELLQEVFLKTPAHAKEEIVGTPRLSVCIFERLKFKCTNVVRNLGKTVTRRRRVTINDRLLGQCKLDGIMQRLGNQSLPVVVVNLNFIELLQVLEMIEQEDSQISPDAIDCTVRSEHVGVKLGFLICEHGVSKRKILKKNTECCEVLLPLLNIHSSISIVAIKQGRKVEGDVPQPFSFQSLEIIRLISSKLIALLVEHNGYEVVLGFRTGIAGLVDKYGEILHGPHAPNIKNAGGKPPAVGGPPCGEDHLLYTTRRVDYSILTKYEHMFSIIETNIRSPHRKAA